MAWRQPNPTTSASILVPSALLPLTGKVLDVPLGVMIAFQVHRALIPILATGCGSKNREDLAVCVGAHRVCALQMVAACGYRDRSHRADLRCRQPIDHRWLHYEIGGIPLPDVDARDRAARYQTTHEFCDTVSDACDHASIAAREAEEWRIYG